MSLLQKNSPALRILGVSGSMHKGSNCAQLTNTILEAARLQGAEVRLLDLYEIDLPMFRAQSAPITHSGRNQANKAVEWADAFVLSTPDYHGSMSGAMKNFLDHYWQEFAGKLFASVCVSHEKGLTAIDQMRTAIRQCYGWSLPYSLSVESGDFAECGTLSNRKCAARAQMLARDLTVYGSLLRAQFIKDLHSAELKTFSAHYR